MRRHVLLYITQPSRAALMPLCCCYPEPSIACSVTHPARSYAHQPSSKASLQTVFPLRQHSSSASSRGLRRRTTAAPARRVTFSEAAGSSHPSDFSDTTVAHALEVSSPTDHATQSLSKRQGHNVADAQRAHHTSHKPMRTSQRPRRPTNTVTSAELLNSLEAQHSPLASTLRKKLASRHTGPHGAVANRHSLHQTDEQRRAAAELRSEEDDAVMKGGYDPALVVQIDSRRRQVRLNNVQRELIWTARQKQYQGLLQRIVACLQSHRSPVEKCQTLFALHDEAIHQHLRLRADTYEDIFHTLYSVGVMRGGGAGQPGKASLSPSAQLVTGDAQWERDLSGCDAARLRGGSLPAELASAAAASSTVLSAHGMEHVWEMYRYAVDSGTDPTARTVQYVMGLLEHASVALAVSRTAPPLAGPAPIAARASRRARSSGLLLVEAKAHSLMMDADRFHLTPSEYTINSYIGICEACDVMHLAMARVTDYQTRHERQASAGMYARLLTGLVRCGRYDDAMATVTTMQNVPMSIYLFNAVLQAARHSGDPTSVFTFYRALFFVPASPLHVDGAQSGRQRRAETRARSSTRLAPSLVTFSILVEVMQATQSCTELGFVLTEMQHFRVKGNGMLLNKLLKLMDRSGASRRERDALRQAMESKDIRVFEENKGVGNHYLST